MTNISASTTRPRLLIEDWLPIAALGEESVRERRALSALPPTYYLHVWWARRPLVASRAAILASLLPADADHDNFLRALGIHGDPVAVRAKIDEAKRTGEDLGTNVYGYKRAFSYTPDEEDVEWLHEQMAKLSHNQAALLDPTAGGGSIPFEGQRLGLQVNANDLNPVAWLILKATADFPFQYGKEVLTRYKQLAKRFQELAGPRFQGVFPQEADGVTVEGYLWARTVTCPYCGGLVPLSPNWKLTSKGTGVQLVPHTEDPEQRHCSFQIVSKAKDHSEGTVKAGKGLCPYPDCGRIFDGDEIKSQAQAGNMGDQLYAVVYKQSVKTGTLKSGKDKFKTVRGFRAPRPEDDVTQQVADALAAKIPEWEARDIVPTEEVLPGAKTDEPRRSGMFTWRDMFSPRQLLGHCTSVEVFHDLVDELRQQHGGELPELDKAALCYIAIAMERLLDWNSRFSLWDVAKQRMSHTFSRHDFGFTWSTSEMAPMISGLGYEWTFKVTGKALKEFINLIDHKARQKELWSAGTTKIQPNITHGSGDDLSIPDQTIDCIVMDPPYYDNVMYAELADFFYVWLKRTAGLLYPEPFSSYLTDKDREAVANPAKFKGEKGGAKNLAGRDYQNRMADIFTECRRVLKPDGVMTVMFTHKASGAWDALANGLVQAGFVITASWPVNTEAEGSLHIKEKSAAKSTIFLVCRPREEQPADEAVYWEEVEPQVVKRVRERVQEFQEAGIGGVDLYLACFGPALQVFSESWPLKRGRPVQKPKEVKLFADEEWDPYAVRPEDALEAARREVKRWRMEQLATVKRQHHLDPLTEFYVLAWDAFKAPRFPSDEALKLARVVGLDFDRDVKNVVCETKSSDVILWDSKTRKAKSKLGPVSEDVMLDTLHHAALIGRNQNTGAAQKVLEEADLLKDSTLLTALEALLNVLPPPGTATGKKNDDTIGGASSDCEALEKLRRLAFSEEVPEPKFVQGTLFPNDNDE
ncbi:DUF1156 domain-containing protein [Planctomicrobium sp. SH527]|uniref:DUF1156 domain-containing protein n=1 Tax=Planctomicrobium sp. SH527 TaxID=3448123 RepID=UPI003F5B426B